MTVRRADDNSYALASNVSATGDPVVIKGGQYMFMARGTVGGATISLQVLLPDGSTWSGVTSLNSNTAISTTALPYAASPIELPAGQVRMAVTGGSPSGLYGYLIGLG